MVVDWLNLLAFCVYSTLTYLIAKDIYKVLVSFSLSQIEFSHLQFKMRNNSKVEVEVFSKLWCKIEDELFEFKGGFYGNKTNWILQPFTDGQGHFYLKDIVNKDGIKIENFVKDNSISSITFYLQIKYRRVGRVKWKKSSPQKFAYDFDNSRFWLNV